MRNSVGLACLMSGIIVSTTTAQCPNTNRSVCRVAQVQSCYPTVPQPTYTVISSQASPCQTFKCAPSHQVVKTCPVVQSCPVQSCPVLQRCPMVQSAAHSSTQFWRAVPQTSVAAATPVFSQNAQHNTQNNCNCSAGATLPKYAPQVGPQAASILEKPRSPFSLSGHVREGAVKPVDHCLQEFLSCCENGGKDCMLNYYKCTEITGEPLRHTACPSPNIDD